MALAMEVDGVIMLVCEWYARCGRGTRRVTEHPILGSVPVCDKCAARHSLETSEVEIVTE